MKPQFCTALVTMLFHGSQRRVDGALGGNALAGLRVTVDDGSGTATFERP